MTWRTHAPRSSTTFSITSATSTPRYLLLQNTTWWPARASAIGIGRYEPPPIGCMKTRTVSDAFGGRSRWASSVTYSPVPPYVSRTSDESRNATRNGTRS